MTGYTTGYKIISTKGYEWIPGFEWYYKINKHWKIISYRRRNNKWAVLSEDPQVFIKPWIKTSKSSKKEFLAVTLYNWLVRQKFYVSRLVAKIFMWYDEKDKTKQIIFKDNNPLNCDIKNLKIWTISETTFNWMNKKYGKPCRMI